jgi:hypothetical protein
MLARNLSNANWFSGTLGASRFNRQQSGETFGV